MAKNSKGGKIFVLDTSVILHDHNSIINFQEHDVAIPITVLEELDNFKRGNDTKNFEAREFIRIIDKLSSGHTLQKWIPLNGKTKGKFKIILDESNSQQDANRVFNASKSDHRILNAALSIGEQEKNKQVILVSKDINLRLKAKALKITAEDYETGKIKDVQSLFSGKKEVNTSSAKSLKDIFSQGFTENKTLMKDLLKNQYLILKSGKSSTLAYYNTKHNRIERVEKQTTFGIKPRNAEQAFALHAIMNPDVKLVTLQGVAGTGKTLLALAGSISQRRDFKQIYLARPIVPLSNKDIGYLPGDANEKIDPYMQPLWDNLKYIKNQYKESDKHFKQIDDMIQSEKLLITPLAYIRGRSLSNVIFIVDEAQNLTPHEIKTIITRAGENTKIIFTGDVNQIDTPYLDEQSNGLSYLIDRVKDNDLFAHVTLEKGERSELANLANELL